MKTYLLPVIGILLGGVTVFWVLAMLFNTPVAEIFPGALLPIGLAALTSFTLTWLEPNKWKLLAVLVALPTLLMAMLLLILLWMEGRNDWRWVLVAGTTLCACAIPSWLAHMQKAKGPNHSFQQTR